MKAEKAIKVGILAGLLVCATGTVSGAKVLSRQKAQPVTPTVSTPELDRADERVSHCKAQVETANKQLTAARALLRAAEADLKAAVAERDALALKTTAKGLADEAGFEPAKAQAPSAKPQTSSSQGTPAPAPETVNPAPTPIADSTGSTRIQQIDFNSEQPAEAAPALR